MKEKIFVCVGTHTQPFDRLLKKMDEIAGKKFVLFEIFGQIGNSNYEPKNFEWKKFLDEKEFHEKISKSDLIIGHAGAGLILTALSKHKKVVIVPRLKEFGEHTDSHQIDIAMALSQKRKVLAAFDVKNLEQTIGQSKKFQPVVDNQSKRIAKEIEEFIKKSG